MSELPRIYRPPRIYRSGEHRDAEPVPPKPAAFMTERGSIYTYDDQGRTTRHKTKTGEEYQAQDLTVFVDMQTQDKDAFVYYLHHNDDPNVKVYVVERQPNDAAVKIRRPEDIKNPDALYLAACRTDPNVQSDHNIQQLLKSRKVQLQPAVGMYAYDTRSYRDEQQKPMTERHLGHRVTEIKYADA